jgi:hypothetical protein
MKRTLILTVTICLATGLLLAGCDKKEPSEPTADSQDSVVKTMDEYREEAAADINAENVEDELAREIEAIEGDTAP